MMQVNIIWTGKLYRSIENCILTKTISGNEIISTIIGNYEKQIYKVDYSVTTNKNWETLSAAIQTQLDNSTGLFSLEKKNEKYFINGEPDERLKNIFDIDISLTPFTNTLPINRLKLKSKERKVIEVIYFDILQKEIKPVKQIYTRLTTNEYLYENYDKSFKAKIKVDNHGLVVDYPKLFEMTAKRKSGYPAKFINKDML